MESTEVRISRRTFLLTALVGGVSICVGSIWFVGSRRGGVAELIASVVRKKLHFLQIDENGLQQFAQDFGELAEATYGDGLNWLTWFRPLYEYTNLLTSVDMVDVPAEQIAGLFMMSSDFFREGSDETRVIEYVRLYDPYSRVCANPFPNLEA